MKKAVKKAVALALGAVLAFSSLSADVYAMSDDQQNISEEVIAGEGNSDASKETDLQSDEAASSSTEKSGNGTLESSDNAAAADEAQTDKSNAGAEPVINEAEEDASGDASEDSSEDSSVTDASTEASSVSDAGEYYTVTYEALDDDVLDLPVDNNHYSYGDTVQVTSQIPTRNGFKFWGWSPTGDPSVTYTHEWSFEITEDVTFYATWTCEDVIVDDYSAPLYSSANGQKEDGIVTAINNYVNSLNGTFNNNFYYEEAWRSKQCCAFCDYVWQDALGITRFSNPKVHKAITSDRKLKGSEIYEFLKANDVKPGDWLWAHDPKSARSYNITHNMIILGYDSDSITISDGYEKNGTGLVWHNNSRVSLTEGGHYDRYFKGNSYITVYKIIDESVRERFNPKNPKPFITSVNEDAVADKYHSFQLTINTSDGDNSAAGNVFVKVWATKDGENSVPENWQDLYTYKANRYTDGGRYTFSFRESNISKLTDYTYVVYLYDDKGELAEKTEPAHISLGVLNQASGKCGDNLTWTLTESANNIGYYNLTISGTGRMDDYLGQQTPWEEQLRTFGQTSTYRYNKITINPGITYIGERAFGNSSTIINVNSGFSIPDTVKEIGDYAFNGFPYTGSIVIPDSVNTLGRSAFSSSKFSSVTIGQGVTVIPSYCFTYCRNLSYVKMSDNVKEIGGEAFRNAGHSATFKLYMSKNIESIGSEAFYDCKTLRIDDLSFFKNLKKLDDNAFVNCEQLSGELELSGNLRNIYGFRNCKSLTKLTLNEGTEEIWYDAFRGCTGLKGTLVIPSSMHWIEARAFLGCSGLTGLEFPEDSTTNDTHWNTRIGNRAFEGCTGLTGDVVLHSNVVYPYDKMSRAFFGCDNVDRFILAGGWSRGSFGSETFTPKGTIGKLEYDYELPEDSVLDTFPENAKIYVDASVFNDNKIPQALYDLGYDVYTLNSGYYPVYELDTPRITLLLSDKDRNTSNKSSASFLYPRFASNKDITVTIKDTSIATVSKESYNSSEWNGDTDLWRFSAKKVGDTTYTVTTADGKFTQTGSLRVVKDKKSVTDVNINAYAYKLSKNEKEKIAYQILPDTAANKAVTWTSSNPKVATVDSNGYLTGKAGGKCVITITTKDGGLTDTCDVTVEADNYTVSFDANGGVGEMPDMFCDPGRKYTLEANTFTRVGYVFDHWNTLPENDEYFYQSNTKYANKASFTDLGKAYDNVTLYASWRPDQSYTIVYDSNSKNSHGAVIYGAMEKDTGYAFNDEDDKVFVSDGDFLARGVSFTSWNTRADGKGITVEAGNEYTPEELGAKELTKSGVQNVVLYAQWKEESYNVRFELDGGSLTDTTFGDSEVTGFAKRGGDATGLYTFGQAVKKLPVAEKKGYTFGGWFFDAACKKAAKTLPANLTSDTTLYAKWTPYKYTLTLDPNKNQDGESLTISGSAKKLTAYYGKELPELKNSFVNKGYKLIGWTNEKGGATALVRADDVFSWETAQPLLGTVANNDKKTLYAVWEKAPYSISYELNMPEKSAAELEEICSSYVRSYEYKDPANADIQLPVPEREGYTFGGWYTDSSLKKLKKSFTATDFGDITLFAKWTAAYTVRLHDNTGVAGDEQTPKAYTGYKYEAVKALPANPFAKADAAFIGWALTAGDSRPAYSNKEKIAAPALTKTEDGLVLDLYAVWKNSFNVEIMTDLNNVSYAKGEKNPLPSTAGFTYTYSDVKKKAITLPKTLVKDGYKFAGWFTNEECTKKITSIGAKNCADYQLYASFKPLSYKITYVANPPMGAKAFGKMPTRKAVFGEEVTINDSDYYISGYIFGGWSLDPKAEKIDFNSGDVYDGSYQKTVKLYAVWFKR